MRSLSSLPFSSSFSESWEQPSSNNSLPASPEPPRSPSITSQESRVSSPKHSFEYKTTRDEDNLNAAVPAIPKTVHFPEFASRNTGQHEVHGEELQGRLRRLSRPSMPPQTPSETPSTTPSTPSTPSTTSSQWERAEYFWRSFVAICIPLLLSALEGSVTNTALPTIAEALNLGTKFSWVATAFLLAATIFQPLYSQLGDMWGRKYPMMVAVVIFAIGSAICGAARSGTALIAGRIVQGLGSGGIDLYAEVILCDIIPLRNRGRYTAIKHTAFAIGTALGPLLGGMFAEKGWRWCFLINVPVCAIALAVMWFWLRVGGGIKSRETKIKDELKKIDYGGTAILTASVVMLLVALSTGGTPAPWSSAPIVTPLILGLLGLVAFPIFELSRWCTHPIMPSSIFTNRTSNLGFVLTAIHGFVTYGFQFYLPPFFQAVKGSSPSKSGLQILPSTLVIVILAATGGPILTHWGKYKPLHVGGFAAMTLGLGLCTTFTKDTPAPGWLIYQFIVAVGIGIVVSTMLSAIQVKLPETATGAAAGSWAFLRGTGSLFGVAIPGAIFNERFAQILSTISNPIAREQLAYGQAYQRASSVFVSEFGPIVKQEIIQGFTESLKCVWITFVIFAGVGLVLTLGEKQYKMRTELNTAYGLEVKSSAPATPTPSGLNTPANELSDWHEVQPHDMV